MEFGQYALAAVTMGALMAAISLCVGKEGPMTGKRVLGAAMTTVLMWVSAYVWFNYHPIIAFMVAVQALLGVVLTLWTLWRWRVRRN